MDVLKRNKILTWIVIFLLICNLGIIGFIWINAKNITPSPQPFKTSDQQWKRGDNKRPDRKARMESRIFQELELNDEQIQIYRKLKRQHIQDVHAILDSIRSNKRLIHQEMFSDEPNITRIENIADSIGQLNAELERLNYLHFLELKNTLNSEQVKKFENFMNQMPYHKSDVKGRHHHRRKNR